ncbi:MAG: DUF5668 domain-containing protein [Acidobacteriia bacterium]|nr:DUF5668 domain-containing protein [Terriglobia bacterium]
MNCAVHTEQQAVGYCRNCGKALCAACTRPVRDVIYCEDCLASLMGHAAPAAAPAAAPVAPAPAASSSSPAVAFILGFFPGLGAIYNGEYNKGLIHILVFAAMVVGLSTVQSDGAETALGLLLAGFIFYMAFDAMRTAQARRAGEPSPDALETWSKEKPVGAILLIVLGALFLLSNFGWFPWDRISQFWPVILIVAGILMLRKRLGHAG